MSTLDDSFSVNDFATFLTWKYSSKEQGIKTGIEPDFEPDNQYRITITPIDDLKYVKINYLLNAKIDFDHPLYLAIEEQFTRIIKYEKRSTVYSFFDYQFDEYYGEKVDFIDFIEWSIKRTGTLEYTGSNKTTNEVRWKLLEWVEKKRNEINTKPIQTGELIENGKPDGKYKHPQQMLLLDRLGIINYLDKYNLTTEKKAVLISKIVGKHPQNTREYLTTMGEPNRKNAYNTPGNNELIDKLLHELGIS